MGTERENRVVVAAADAVEASQREQTRDLTTDADSLLAEYGRVSDTFEEAEARFKTSEQTALAAASDYASAIAAYHDAERNWRWTVYVVLAAATWDLAGEICDGVQSTRSYRRDLGLDRGVCVDHSFAHALGGINHPWNYAPLDCGENSAYGAAFWSKLAGMPVDVLRGLAVSALARLRCGTMARAWSR